MPHQTPDKEIPGSEIPLKTILNTLDPEQRLSFLRAAYRPERRDVAEALLSALEPSADSRVSQTRGEFNSIIKNLIAQAESPKKRSDLQFREITSYRYPQDIEAAAKATNDPALIERVIEHYRREYFNNAEMVMNLLEHLGRTDEVREYGLEAAQAVSSNHGFFASQIYLHLGMFQEAIEVRLRNGDFDGAIRMAQTHLSPDELPAFYRRVYDAVRGYGYDNGFPVQIEVAQLLGDRELEGQAKKAYFEFIKKSREREYLDLVREVGTPEDLVEFHRRIVDFYLNESRHPGHNLESLARAAEEAYKDLSDVKYARIAMENYAKLGRFEKALEYARIVDPKKAKIFERALQLTQESA